MLKYGRLALVDELSGRPARSPPPHGDDDRPRRAGPSRAADADPPPAVDRRPRRRAAPRAGHDRPPRDRA